MKLRKAIILIICIIATLSSSASILDGKKTRQLKADMDGARTAIKKGQNLEKYEIIIRNYISDSLYSDRKELHLLLIELLQKQYAIGNEKMYLGQAVDTASISKINKTLFIAAEVFDSLDARPNSKGVSSPSYRKKHAQLLTPLRANLLKGGIYFLSHKDYQEAWNVLDTYLEVPKQPLFFDTPQDSTYNNFAAFLAVMAASRLNSIDKAETYAEEALQYIPRRELTLKRLSTLALDNSNSAKYIHYIKEGFNYYPESDFFFPRLIDYYVEKKDYITPMSYTDKALKKDSLNPLFLIAKHNILMSTRKYDEAMKYGKQVLLLDEDNPIVNYNIGYIYYIKAQDANKDYSKSLRQRTKDAQKYYTLCKPFMEKYRKLKPQASSQWKPILYDVYLNLNMGKEFTELQ